MGKLKICIFVLVLMTCSYSKSHADESSPAQELKKDFVGSCVTRGISQGAHPDAAYSFCSCSWGVISKNLTVSEYIQMDALAMNNGDMAGQKSFLRLQPKLQACKDSEAKAINP